MPVQHLSDDDLLASFSGEPAAPSVKGMSDDAVLSNFAGAAFTDYAPVKSEAKTKAQSFVPGMKQGMIDVAGNIPIDAVQDYTKSQTAQFDKDYAGDNLANVGRAAGNIMVTAPLMAAGGAGLGMAGRSLAIAAPRVAPAVDFLSGSSNFWKTANGTPLTTGEKLLGAASKFTAGAESGAAANVLATGTSDESIPQRALEGAEVGGPLALVPTAAKTVKNALTGGGVKPEVANLAHVAENKYDIPLRAGQISESPFIHYLDSLLSKMPFTGYAAKDEAARTAFTKAVSRTFGEDAPALTQDVMSDARKRIGGVLNEAADKTSIKIEGKLFDALAKIENNTPPSQAADVKFYIDKITKDAKGGVIDGKTYQELTNSKSALAKASAKGDPAARAVEEALHDALEAQAPKELRDQVTQAKSQYKNLMAVKDLAAKAGIEGEITPGALAGAVRKHYKDFAFSGAGDIGELGQIGQRFLKEAGSSGTGERLTALDLLKSGGAALAGGAAAPFAVSNPAHAAAGAAALVGLLGAGRLTASALNSTLYKNALINSGRNAGTPGMLARLSANPSVQNIAPGAGAILENRLTQ